MAYAATTTVPFERSISEIVTLVKRAGANQIGQQDLEDRFIIAFKLVDRLIKFTLPMVTEYAGPEKAGNGKAIDAARKIEQHNRQRGRALLLVIKAKLESVESGIETIEQAFLANVVLSNGETVYDRVSQPIALEYREGRPDNSVGLLPPPGGSRA